MSIAPEIARSAPFASSRYFLRTVIPVHFRSKPAFVVAMVLTALNAASLVMLPMVGNWGLEAFRNGHSSLGGPIASYIAVVATAAIWIASSSANNHFQDVWAQRTVMLARVRLYGEWLRRVPRSGDARLGILNRLDYDAHGVRLGIDAVTRVLPVALLQVAGAIIGMLVISATLTVALLLCTVVVAIALASSERSIARCSELVDQLSVEATSLANEILANVRLVQRYDQEENETETYRRLQGRLSEAFQVRRRALLRGRMAMYAALGVGLGAVVALGLSMVKASWMTAEALISFFFLTVIFGSSLVIMFDAITTLARSADPAMRLFESFGDRMQRSLPPPLAEAGRRIIIDSVNFEYEGRYGESFSLSIPYLNIDPGSTIAIVGHSGSGKSTLLKLIAGENKPDRGQITFDDLDVHLLDPASRVKIVSYIDPVPVLLSRSIEDNILFGRADQKRHLEKAIVSAGLGPVLAVLPHGLDTVASQARDDFSSGQRQRVAVARGILQHADVLLLDEAMSSIDASSERLIHQHLNQNFPNSTKIIVSHRLSSIQIASCIYVMSNGEIIDRGSHSQLMARSSHYVGLFGDQV